MTQQVSKPQKETLGALPTWDLSDLYPSADSDAYRADCESVDQDAKTFRRDYAGRLAKLDGKELAEAIARYEAIEERLVRLSSFAQLTYSADMSAPENGRLLQSVQELGTEVNAELLFFALELNDISEERLESLYAEPTLARYRPWLRDLRAFRPYQLSEDLERLFNDKQVTGRAAWTRLFDETMAALRFSFDGEMLSSAEILHKMTDPQETVRKEAALSFSRGLQERLPSFALITNTLARDKATEDTWRGFARPVSSRNLANFVEDEVVDALVEAVTESYPRLAHRYYQRKAQWLGKERMPYWDRNAPLPEADDRVIPWEEARETVLSAYGGFSSNLADIGKRFFDNAWIHAPVAPGKAPGAFAHPTVPSAHPYLLLNYQGRPRDVTTLAHELGHGVHQVLAGPQGHLMASTPLTLAETASVFGEMLTFQALLKQTQDATQRKVMLATKVEDMLNTVVRQIAFHRFETELHQRRAEGELLPDEIAEIWMATQQESLGPAFDFDDSYRAYWAYIPHFIHVPFYVYAYAFGDCLVNSLYAVYQEADAGFAEKYMEMLSAGGTRRHKELLAPFGLDASDPAFWNKGLAVIEGLIDELEALDSTQ